MKHNEYSISSVEKLFGIVEIMSKKNGDFTITEIAARLNSSISSINRFLQTMEDMGYVNKNEFTKRYYLTNKFLTISNSLIACDKTVNTMLPLARMFANKYDVMVNVNTMQDKDAIMMYRISRYNVKEMDYKIGEPTPAYAVGPGRAMLSLYSPKELDDFLKDIDLIKYQRNTIADKNRLRTNLEDVKKKGYAASFEEFRIGIFSLSFPVKTRGGCYYCITLITPITEYKKVYNKQVIDEIKKVMEEKKEELES